MTAPAPIVSIAFAVAATTIATSYIYHLELCDRREHRREERKDLYEHDDLLQAKEQEALEEKKKRLDMRQKRLRDREIELDRREGKIR